MEKAQDQMERQQGCAKGTPDFFRKRRRTDLLLAACVLGLFVFSSALTGFSLADGISSVPRALVWMGQNLIPDEQALTRLPKVLSRLYETAMLSVAVTVLAAVLAFLFSLAGSKTTGRGRLFPRLVRIVAAFFRNVPDVVWSILLMFSFGQNILTGFFALFFTTFGLLTRAFIETVDEVSASCVEALTSTGASFFPIVSQGVIPSAMSGLMTWILYMIETNIRSSTLIGILTGTGIGYLFDLYYKRLEYPTASLVVLSIVVLVLLIETISNRVRRAIL